MKVHWAEKHSAEYRQLRAEAVWHQKVLQPDVHYRHATADDLQRVNTKRAIDPMLASTARATLAQTVGIAPPCNPYAFLAQGAAYARGEPIALPSNGGGGAARTYSYSSRVGKRKSRHGFPVF